MKEKIKEKVKKRKGEKRKSKIDETEARLIGNCIFVFALRLNCYGHVERRGGEPLLQKVKDFEVDGKRRRCNSKRR